MRNCSFRNSAKCFSHVGDISLSRVMCIYMVALVMKNSSIGVGSIPFIQSNINFDSSNLYRSSSFSILLRINNGSVLAL